MNFNINSMNYSDISMKIPGRFSDIFEFFMNCIACQSFTEMLEYLYLKKKGQFNYGKSNCNHHYGKW